MKLGKFGILRESNLGKISNFKFGTLRGDSLQKLLKQKLLKQKLLFAKISFTMEKL